MSPGPVPPLRLWQAAGTGDWPGRAFRRLAPLAVLLALVAGCGGGAGRHDVTLWVTRDLGATVLRTETVSSDATAAEALEGVAHVKTAYSGDFVLAIDGLEATSHSDWFYYVNGYASDRGAADYLLRPGDVEWWDYRHWDDPGEHALVVGAFPEPFLHGFDGKTRPAAVRYALPGQRAAALRLGRIVHARTVAPTSVPVPPEANELLLATGAPRFLIRFRAGSGSAGDPVEVVFAGDAAALARAPHRYRFRYAVR